MMIPSQAIALVWALRAKGAPDKAIQEVLQKPLTPLPALPRTFGWFHAWRKAHEERGS